MAGIDQLPGERSSRRWLYALLLTLVWHLLVGVGMHLLDPFAAEAEPSPRPPVELVFAPTAPPVAEPEREPSDEPDFFTELPEDRADLPPDEADVLSNVDSRARDGAEGEEATDMPRMEGEGDAPQVGLQPSPEPSPVGGGRPDAPEEEQAEQPEPIQDPSAEEPSPSESEIERLGQRAEVGERIREGETGSSTEREEGSLRSARGDPRQSLQPGRVEVSPEPRFRVGPGREDLYQEEMDNPQGNVPLFGDVSLNTVAWNWAPWLQRFSREFHRNWVPPYAYWLGLIEGGQLVEVEIAPDGRLLKLEVLEENGHESLREATVGNFSGIAPYHPLPDDFPEPTLRLTVRVTYRGRD